MSKRMNMKNNTNYGESAIINFQPMPKRFMVWDIKAKEFIKSINTFDYYIGSYINAETTRIIEFMDNPEFVIVQSTNLFDKDGKEIFEGSIVEVYENYNWGNGDNERHFFGEVVNDWGRWCVNAMCGDDELMQPLYEIRTEDITLTGHILSNLELLEEEMCKNCKSCKYYEDFVSVCCNGASEKRADFVYPDDSCKEWEKKVV